MSDRSDLLNRNLKVSWPLIQYTCIFNIGVRVDS